MKKREIVPNFGNRGVLALNPSVDDPFMRTVKGRFPFVGGMTMLSGNLIVQ